MPLDSRFISHEQVRAMICRVTDGDHRVVSASCFDTTTTSRHAVIRPLTRRERVETTVIVTASDPTTAFRELIALYEHQGWQVRSLDLNLQRAFVRRGAIEVDEQQRAPSVLLERKTMRNTICRKLWVDGVGQTQETDVPC
jgi:hypothetical protein